MWARDTDGKWRVTVLAEEADAAYARVGLVYATRIGPGGEVQVGC